MSKVIYDFHNKAVKKSLAMESCRKYTNQKFDVAINCLKFETANITGQLH